MIRRNLFVLFMTMVLIVCNFAFFVLAQDNEDTDNYKIEADIGYHSINHNDYPGKVGEYNILDHDATGPDMKISGTTQSKNLYLDFGILHQIQKVVYTFHFLNFECNYSDWILEPITCLHSNVFQKVLTS